MSKTSETGGLRPLEPPGTAVALVLSIGLGLAIGLLASEYRAWKQVKSLEAQETVAGEARWECVMPLAGKTGPASKRPGAAATAPGRPWRGCSGNSASSGKAKRRQEPRRLIPALLGV